MSFLFKSSKKAGAPVNPNALPPATREIRSSDGPASQIPSINGVSGINGATKPSSPTPSSNVNNSIASIQGNERIGLRASPMEEKQAQPGQEQLRGSGPPSPEQKVIRERSQDAGQRLPAQTRAPPGDSPYPWSQRRLTFTVTHTNPFPRYGAAVNATASKDGSIYLMGGLINGSTVKGDLWMVEATPASMTCFPVATTSEGPGPRVGHASLLVGNAFIVFGGDTKMDEGDMLDDTLYLLNTSTKQWSRALPAGPRPPGRYGHTLNILGSKIYIFGGQVEGYFFNDLVAFDLNALQQASNKWEILIQNTIDGGPPHGQIPPARTNHSIVSWNDQLYLFGGTDGVHWFNDVWSYNPHTNSWTQLECIGYIPSAREGHAAALVGDVMYIFGGRTEEGTDLGDLAAFRISSRRWYTFQNMGPSPSPRSGHSMTTVGKQIVVLAGEPSTAPRDPVELAMAYFLDTSKIRYPADNTGQGSAGERAQGNRRPSGERSGIPMSPGLGRGQMPRELMERERQNSTDSSRARSESSSRLPRPGPQAALPAPSGPPPQQQPPQPRTNGVPSARQPSRPDRPFSPPNESDRALRFEERAATASPQLQNPRDSPAFQTPRGVTSPTFGEEQSSTDASQPKRQKPETYQPTQEPPEDSVTRSPPKTQHLSDTPEDAPGKAEQPHAEQMPKVRQMQRDDADQPQDSGIGSSPALTQQHDELARELDSLKQKNAWYASELALARKSGYQARATDSPAFDERAVDIFGEDDKPLVEAFLKMRAELARVQTTIDTQSRHTAERIADMEKQRDVAISEAVLAKARFAGSSGEHDGSHGTADADRHSELNKRLAVSLASQAELSRKINSLTQQIETEQRSRELAEDTADAAQKRLAELDASRQRYTSEIESLRSELHETQKEAREALANHADISAQHKLMSIDKQEMNGRLERSLSESQNHGSILSSLKDAVTTTTDKANMLEEKLAVERRERSALEDKLAALQTEHEARRGELESTTRRLRDAEDLSDKHAREAESHRSAVLAGLGKITEHDYDIHEAADERVTILQQQVLTANSLMRQNQAAANVASEKLRRAEERIAGLETYQEQASREGLMIRKQLQQTMKDMQHLSSEKSDLELKLQSQQLETNALSVQHGALKDILGERGINASEVRRSRAIDSPSSLSRFSTPDLQRVRELEHQLDASLKSHDEMKAQFEEVSDRDEKMKREYEEKLSALDNDHQAAVKYLRGTEKMLSKMKQELQRVKNENGDMRKKLDKARSTPDEGHRDMSEAPADWEVEKDRLRREVEETQTSLKSSVAALEGKIANIHDQLHTAEAELHQSRTLHATSQADLSTLQATHSQSRTDIERLQKENGLLEERARDAENKVQLLLDQVESSVDNYRRQSRMSIGPVMNGVRHSRNLSNNSAGTHSHMHSHSHSRTDSDAGESTYSGGDAGEGTDARNSMALDTLASELDALRTHWETTNRNYRLSDRFDFERTPTTAAAVGGEFAPLPSWRRGLDVVDDEDGSENHAITEHHQTPTASTHAGATLTGSN